MEEIKRKQEEKAAEETAESEDGGRKRKRDDEDEDETDELLKRESKLLKAGDELQKAEDEMEPAKDEDIENEEADLLEQALDTMQEDTEAGAKTREEAEADRRKLLAGELLVEGDVESDEEDETGYAGDIARQAVLPSKKKTKASNIRSLPLPKEDADLLRKLGCPVVSDEETKIVGVNQVLPWRKVANSDSKPVAPVKITFRTKFDIVELDANGRIVDKGDEDFTPSAGWTGRKAGFEFKLGERGLGYYRTGKKVVIPSNTAY